MGKTIHCFKRVCASVLVVVLLLMLAPTQVIAAPAQEVTTGGAKGVAASVYVGDYDNDGEITVADALTALRIAAKLVAETPEAIEIGDIDGDGKITVADALSILRVAARLSEPIVIGGTHIVVFVDWNGTELKREVVDHGGNATPPVTPSRDGYVFVEWNGSYTNVKNDITVTATYRLMNDNESRIIYHLAYVREENNNGTVRIIEDNYLKQNTNTIVNDNASVYTEGRSLTINDPTADGYDFLGWYEYPEENARRVYYISSEDRGDKHIYAIWHKHVYTITYLPDSASSILPKIPDETFTVDKETSLQVPSWPNLVWVGWSDEDGNILKSIPKGTAHDVTLTANWMSKRNQTVPNNKYATSIPAIVEEDGIIAFAYEIGDIQNVPIQQVEEGVDGRGFNLVKGQTHEISKTFTEKIEQSEATNVSNTISNATTKSDSWTLSEDWNESTSVSREHENEVTEEQMAKATQSYSATNKYTLSSGYGGTVEHTDETGKSNKVTKYQELGGSYNSKTSFNVGLEAGIGKKDIASVGGSAGVGGEQSFGINYKNGREDVNEKTEKHTDKASLTWNTNKGFETSATCSASSELSQKIGQSVKDMYKYGEVLDFGGSNSNTVSSSNTNSESREYGSSVTYSTESGSSLTVKETLTADADTGYYRKVLAANFRVFAVVIYDIESGAFSTMTYSLKINDSEHLFTDYSTVSSFDDYENGVLPFSVPLYVAEYVYGIVGASDGLRINSETGIIEGYGYKDPATGICYKKHNILTDVYSEPCDEDVVLPKYIVVDLDGTNRKIVEVTGISDSAFSGTTIRSIHLNEGVTSIPAGAFENCSNLFYITGPSITEIGRNAFKNCPSLCEMTIASKVTSLGAGAFDGDSGATVFAASPEIVNTAMRFNVSYLTIDLNDINGSLDNNTLLAPNGLIYFCLNGGGKTFNNLVIESDAGTTEINNITINCNSGCPLKASSQDVNLGYVRFTASGFALNLMSNRTIITLNGNNYIVSNSENAILSKSMIVVEKEGSSSIGRMRVTGNALVYGDVRGNQNVLFDSSAHSFRYLTAEEYDQFFSSMKLVFNPTGGTVSYSTKTIYCGIAIGELPVPARDYYTFKGWFTAIDGGVEITASTVYNSPENINAYAHWEINPLSDWVSASEVPYGAQVANRKYRYDYASYYTPDSPIVSGWTQYKSSTWAWGDYGSWSSWSTTAYSGSESRQVETKTVTDQAEYYTYKYWIYRTSDGYGFGTKNYETGSHGKCTKYDEIILTYRLGNNHPSLSYLYGPYDSSMFSHSYDKWWFFDEDTGVTYYPAITHTEYRYRNRSKLYTYYLESSNNPTGESGVSNVEELVQYRMK